MLHEQNPFTSGHSHTSSVTSPNEFEAFCSLLQAQKVVAHLAVQEIHEFFSAGIEEVVSEIGADPGSTKKHKITFFRASRRECQGCVCFYWGNFTKVELNGWINSWRSVGRDFLVCSSGKIWGGIGFAAVIISGGFWEKKESAQNVNFIDYYWLDKVLEDGSGVNFWSEMKTQVSPKCSGGLSLTPARTCSAFFSFLLENGMEFQKSWIIVK